MIGILAYGSLIKSPGQDIAALVVKRIPMKTPFPIEFARYSRKRAGAPTVVPVRKGGRRVNAQILVLREDTTLQRAKTILWLREINQVGASREYTSNRAKNAVQIRTMSSFCGISTVLYTDFYASTKIRRPNPKNLAKRAIKSAREA